MTSKSNQTKEITQGMHEDSDKDDKYCSNKAQVKIQMPKTLPKVILPKLITKLTKEACSIKVKYRLPELHEKWPN